MSPLCLAMSPTTERRGMFVFVEGGGSGSPPPLQYTIPDILSSASSWWMRCRRKSTWSCRKTGKLWSAFHNCVIFKWVSACAVQILPTVHSKKPVSPTGLATAWEEIPVIGFGANRTPFPTIYSWQVKTPGATSWDQ